MAKLIDLQNFGNAVRVARLKEKKSQKQLCKKVAALLPESAPNFYQEKLSKIERAVPTLALTKDEIQILQQVCKLEDSVVEPLLRSLDEPEEAEEFTTYNSDELPCQRTKIYIPEAGQLHSNISAPTSELKGYCGEYYTLFLSTDSADKRLVEGKLVISQDQTDPSLCDVHLTLYGSKRNAIRWCRQ